MGDTNKAVFLSYAREDAAAASRIADALRSQGIEVWFDQSELRGGDAWDAKIRKQIDDCTLFLPIISRTTQDRGKGYFRLEWKLAVEQTHLLAEGIAFLAPVVIDDTTESGALVPPEFMRVQWTRLPGALPTPQFVGQIKRLLDGQKSSVEAGRPRPAEAAAAVPSKKSKPPAWTWGAWTAVVVGIATAVMVSQKQHAPPPVPPAAAPAPAADSPSAPHKDDKSIAVLPFTNMSEDKDNQFFADGIHEDILTNLALVREFRVVSRTSVMPYRTTNKSMRQIAQELGVTYILEGSVRRSGNKVRVTGQLIHAGSDEHIWAEAYDRDVSDVFAIQAELSKQIAATLKTVLSPEEKVLIARRPTANPAAYDLYLRARDVSNREGVTDSATHQRVLFLESALKLDPNFALAWAELADAYAFAGFTFEPGMDELLAKAKQAIERAVQLAPDDPGVIGSLGTYYYYGYRDYARATEQYERLARLQPNDPTVFNSLGLIQRRQGRWADSLANIRKASELDPANIKFLRNLVADLTAGNRYPELEAARRRLAALRPERLDEALNLATVPFLARGSTREGDEFIAKLTPEQANSAQGIDVRKSWARTRGDWAEATRLDRLQPYYDEDDTPHTEQAVFAAIDLLAQGDRAAAIARLGDFPEQMRRQAEAEPRNARQLGFLADMEAIVGRKADALRYADRSAELVPVSMDALDGVSYATFRVFVYDLAGEKERALAEYTRLIRAPSPSALLNVHSLKTAPSTLRGDPRFEALLDDPANNAPLF